MKANELTVCQNELETIRTSDEALLWKERWAGPLIREVAAAHVLIGPDLLEIPELLDVQERAL